MLEEVLTAWFLIGRLGGFDATNLQVMQSCTLLCIALCKTCSSWLHTKMSHRCCKTVGERRVSWSTTQVLLARALQPASMT